MRLGNCCTRAHLLLSGLGLGKVPDRSWLGPLESESAYGSQQLCPRLPQWVGIGLPLDKIIVRLLSSSTFC